MNVFLIFRTWSKVQLFIIGFLRLSIAYDSIEEDSIRAWRIKSDLKRKSERATVGIGTFSKVNRLLSNISDVKDHSSDV